MRYTIHTDGGSRGNPGPSAIGVVVLDETQTTVFELSKYIGITTNNEAEYQALQASLEWLLDHQADVTEVIWKLDSKLILEQVQKHWKIKEPRLLVYAQNCWKLLEKITCDYSLMYIPRAQNVCADALVNQALDSQAA